MVVDKNKMIFVVEAEFYDLILHLASKLNAYDASKFDQYEKRVLRYYMASGHYYNSTLDTKKLFNDTLAKINAKYIPPKNGSLGCHTLEFNNEMTRFAFQFKHMSDL